SVGLGTPGVDVRPGRNSFSTRVDATQTLGVFVDITAGINLATGVVTWTFTSIDPQTGDIPSAVDAGFLPPDKTPPIGDGFVNYTIRPKANLATGATLPAKATVNFDGVPLDPAPILNTIDVTAPTATVAALPARSPKVFLVRWSASDGANGSGIGSYDVFVSDNNGAFRLFQAATKLTAASF